MDSRVFKVLVEGEWLLVMFKNVFGVSDSSLVMGCVVGGLPSWVDGYELGFTFNESETLVLFTSKVASQQKMKSYVVSREHYHELFGVERDRVVALEGL